MVGRYQNIIFCPEKCSIYISIKNVVNTVGKCAGWGILSGQAIRERGTQMEVELTKEEIKVILDLIEERSAFLVVHGGSVQYCGAELEEKLRRYLNPWTALKIHKSTDEETIIGKFDERHRAINAINVARDIDLKDRKTCFNYVIESKF
ncbi:hypothetical protein ES705_42469 [subsurface metagenome]